MSLKNAMAIPTPSSISYMWNLGSLLGVCLFTQVVTGVFLSFFYVPTLAGAFDSLISLSEEVWGGWLIRSAHANGASLFFALVFTHVGRGLYFASYENVRAWLSGIVILLLLMGSAFVGYVLPWGQMSFWGATVITNLLSSLPLGEDLVCWVWGGYSVGVPTLSRFYSLHFILPIVVGVVSLLHVALLHENGSSNPLGLSADADKIHFHPLFTLKDLLGYAFVLGGLSFVAVTCPDLFMDSDNSTEANPMITPAHIQPEWYFLFAYAILRSVPSNVGGVVCMTSSLLVLLLPPLLSSGGSCSSSKPKTVVFYSFVGAFLFLTWVGSSPAEGSMVLAGRVGSAAYFSTIFLLSTL